MGLTVAVTGPTGEIGVSAVTALEREPAVEKIVAMARRPFTPPTRGWVKTRYQQGDILDRGAVDALVAQADVVIHLAFLIMGSRDESTHVNLQGTRNVFEAAVAAGRPRRLVYTSSVAAYGYHSDNPVPLTEDVPTRGSAEHYYSAEGGVRGRARRHHQGFVVGRLCPAAVHRRRAPGPGVGERGAVEAAARPGAGGGQGGAGVEAGRAGSGFSVAAGAPRRRRDRDRAGGHRSGAARAYNIAGDGEVTIADVAKALGGRPVRVPATAASAAISRLPVVPAAVEWLHVARTSVVMDTRKAQRHLGWRPTHSSAETLAALAKAV